LKGSCHEDESIRRVGVRGCVVGWGRRAVGQPRCPEGRQGREGPRQRAAASESVKLDEEQKGKVHAVLEDAVAQAKALQQDAKAARAEGEAKPDKKEGRSAVADLVLQTKQRIEGILRDDQKTAFRAAFDAERAKAKAERGAKGEGKGAAKGEGKGKKKV
jgi:hypothetical protein